MAVEAAEAEDIEMIPESSQDTKHSDSLPLKDTKKFETKPFETANGTGDSKEWNSPDSKPRAMPVNSASNIACARHLDENKQNLVSVTTMRQNFTSMFMEMEDNSSAIKNFLAVKGFIFKTAINSLKSHPQFPSLVKQQSDYYGTSFSLKPVQQTDGLEIISMVPAQCKKRDLPPAGELKRRDLVLGSKVWALNSTLTSEWVKGTILSCREFNEEKLFKWRNERTKSIHPKLYNAKQFAYDTPADVIVPVGTRIVARYVDKNKAAMFAGIVAEPPKITNRERYLVFFDDGYAHYVNHEDIFVVSEQSADVANDVHENIRPFIRLYLAKYPERAMVKLQKYQNTKVELQGDWCDAKVIDVDSSMIKVQFFSSQEKEWIYRGSTRLKLLYNELASAEAHRQGGGKLRRHNIVPRRPHQPYVEYTREQEVVTIDSDSDSEKKENNARPQHARRKTGGAQYLGSAEKPRNTARKSTGGQARSNTQEPGEYYKPDLKSHVGFKDMHQLKTYSRAVYVVHDCNPNCRERDDPVRYKGKNPLLIPIFLGWERQVRKMRSRGVKITVLYRAPCGRHLRTMEEVQKYLFLTESKITIDFFSFDSNLLAFRTFRPKDVFYRNDDVTQGKENVPVSCINGITNQPPPVVEYASARFPGEGVYLNLDPEFLCGCDCTDNCQNSARCNCQRLTNYARTGNPIGPAVYNYRRLKEPIVTGLYECNERCSCGPQCGNRVVQNGLQLRLQMFKTLHKGWGIRCMDDIDAGMFICIYAGQLLTEQGADRDGNQFGDEYLAELDHIEVVEKCKEGYESDVADMDVDDQSEKETETNNDRDSDEPSASSDSDVNMYADADADSDSDFESTSLRTTASCTYATRSRQKTSKKNHLDSSSMCNGSSKNVGMNGDSSNHESETKELPDITISLGRAVAKKSLSMKHPVTPIMPPSVKFPKFKSIRNYYGEDSLYLMDAKSKGNIGRYLNHSCRPNVFVQNVFVDTHDLRFPCVAFFAQDFISAGAELTWDYNYEVGSVADKVMYCYCESKECRGRLL